MEFVKIRGKKLYYQDVGEGYPILFGHSFLWTSSMWEPQIAILSQKYRCIVPDLWGHGKSESYGLCEIQDMADDHNSLMQSLGISKFAIVGLSVGGMWGIDLALNYPDSVSHLVVMDSYVGPEPQQTFIKYNIMLDTAEEIGAFSESLIDSLIPIFFSPRTAENNLPLVNKFKLHLKSLQSDQVRAIVKIGRGIFSRRSLLGTLEKIRIPTLIMVGQDDRPRPISEARQMAELIDNSELMVVPEAGHISNLEQPELVTSYLERFLG